MMLIRFSLIPTIFIVAILSLEGAQWYFMPNFGGDVRGVEKHRPARINNDFEDWNCQRHINERGNHSKDWCNPGMQHKTIGRYDD